MVEGVGEADAFDRRLGDPADFGRRLDPEGVEDGRDHVDGVGVLAADFASRLDPGRPGTMKGSLMPPR